jgi:dephospho-CoA kinase
MSGDPTNDKPIIGLIGGIGAGKTTLSHEMAEHGGLVINADVHAREAIEDDDVKQQLREVFGDEVITSDGEVNRGRLADLIFENQRNRQIVESLVHPKVAARRQKMIAQAQADPDVKFIVLDVPLLFEVRLNEQCDHVVFVDTSREHRLQRLSDRRGWTDSELERREKNQMPLDRKREMADHVIDNNASEADAQRQVRDVLARIL